MPFHALDRHALRIGIEAFRADRDVLIDLDAAADGCGLADDDACSVVDEERFADRCAGMDVDAGPSVRVLRHHARQQRHARCVQKVRQPKGRDRREGGVAEDDLVDALCRGIAHVCRLQIGFQHAIHLGQRFYERSRHGFGVSGVGGQHGKKRGQQLRRFKKRLLAHDRFSRMARKHRVDQPVRHALRTAFECAEIACADVPLVRVAQRIRSPADQFSESVFHRQSS